MRQTSQRPKAARQILVGKGTNIPLFVWLEKDRVKGLVCMQIEGKWCYAELDKDAAWLTSFFKFEKGLLVCK